MAATATPFVFLATFALLAALGASRNALSTDQTLSTGESLDLSPYTLDMQQDCNLVLYQNHQATWASGTNGKGNNCRATMQGDGNLVIYDGSGRAVWASNTNKGQGDYFLILQPDGNLVVYQGSPIWATNTGHLTNNGTASAWKNATVETGAGGIAMVTRKVSV